MNLLFKSKLPTVSCSWIFSSQILISVNFTSLANVILSAQLVGYLDNMDRCSPPPPTTRILLPNSLISDCFLIQGHSWGESIHQPIIKGSVDRGTHPCLSQLRHILLFCISVNNQISFFTIHPNKNYISGLCKTGSSITSYKFIGYSFIKDLQD